MNVREMMEACLLRLNDYHYIQCTSRAPDARCSCGLHVIKSAIRDNFNAIEREGFRDGLQAAAEMCHDRIHGSCAVEILALKDKT